MIASALAAATRAALLTVLCAGSAVALAQYKVVGPDGRVTYTDRPPVNEPGKVTGIGRQARTTPDGAAAADGSLPYELRTVVARYPVVLYTRSSCAPCDQARQALQQRGIPFDERLIVNDDDALALEARVGARTVPALRIGNQALRGYAPDEWASYLDAAGYPKTSRLPRGWKPLPATPLAPRAASAATGAADTPARPADPAADGSPAAASPAPPSRIRF